MPLAPAIQLSVSSYRTLTQIRRSFCFFLRCVSCFLSIRKLKYICAKIKFNSSFANYTIHTSSIHLSNRILKETKMKIYVIKKKIIRTVRGCVRVFQISRNIEIIHVVVIFFANTKYFRHTREILRHIEREKEGEREE